MTLLINITKKEEKLLKELSDLHKDKMTLIKKFEKEIIEDAIKNKDYEIYK